MSNVLNGPNMASVPHGRGDVELMIVGPEGDAKQVGVLELFGALFRPAPLHEFDPREGIIQTPLTDGQGVENPDSI